MTRKSDAEQRLWFRSMRVFASNGKWYFHTREGVDCGPYDTQFEAEVEAGILRELLRESDAESGERVRGVVRQFVVESFGAECPRAPVVKVGDATEH
jgi:hypothetical protein